MEPEAKSTPEQRERWRKKAAERYARAKTEIGERRHAAGVPCRGCGTPRVVKRGSTEEPLCHACRRAENERLSEIEAVIRTERLAARAANAKPRPRRKGSGRAGTGNRPYRRNRLIILTASDVCGICGHPGSATVDHIVSAVHWPKGPDGNRLPGFDELANLQPAHGVAGVFLNRCPTCDRLCNQSRGSRPLPSRRE